MATAKKPASSAAKRPVPKSAFTKTASKAATAKKAAPRSATSKRPAESTPRRTASKSSAAKGAPKGAAKKAAPKGAAPASAAVRFADANPAVEDYFAAQAPDKRALLEQLRALVAEGVPDAQASIKWGVSFYQRNGKTVCAPAAFKEHVAINFFAPLEAIVDPDGRLDGGGQTNRALKVRSDADIEAARIGRRLEAAVVASS